MKRAILVWLYSALAVTASFCAIYVAVQQSYRQSANDPQIAMAEDAALQLEEGASPADVVPRGMPLLDLNRSNGTWIAIYDQSGAPLESSAQLNNVPPQPPKGLFDDSTWVAHKIWNVPAGKETRVTWEPAVDTRPHSGRDTFAEVRQALVLVKYSDRGTTGFVAVGRSLHPTEERIIQLGHNLLVALAFTLACLLIASFFANPVLEK